VCAANRHRAVGEEFSTGLAHGAVVRFIRGVTDALDLGSATRARLFVATVNGHAFAKGGNVFGESSSCFRAEARGPTRKRSAGGLEKAMYFRGCEFLSERKRRKFCLEQDFVGVGVADPAEKTRVGEGALQRVICGK
jgi:hypothetical protein